MTEFYETPPADCPPEKLTVIYWAENALPFERVVEVPLPELPPDIKKEDIVGYYL